MLREGLPELRFERIEGVADRELLVADNPADPRNRRISILLTGQAEPLVIEPDGVST